jgi:hypothetical protein
MNFTILHIKKLFAVKQIKIVVANKEFAYAYYYIIVILIALFDCERVLLDLMSMLFEVPGFYACMFVRKYLTSIHTE